MERLDQKILFFCALVIALAIHEFGHAYVAWRLGDSTARQQGRVTLNPLNHLDPFGTLMLVFMAFSEVGLGWAKPVPVNPFNLKNPRRDLAWISFAGPGSNFIQALIASLVFIAFLKFNIVDTQVKSGPNALIVSGLVIFTQVNISLFFFNMLPIYPLDGSKIISVFMPQNIAFRFEKKMYELGMKPFIVLIVLEFMLGKSGLGPFSLVLEPLISFMNYALFFGWAAVFGINLA